MSIATPNQDIWIPDRQLLFKTIAGVMLAVGGSLDAYGRSEAYERRILTHGNGQLLPGTGSIIVSVLGVFPGKAGQQQFQFAMGDLGKIVQRFARVRILMGTPWTSITGGLQPDLPAPELTAEEASQLYEDGWIAYSALMAYSLGGVVTDPPVAPIPQDNVILTQMVPYGPQGSIAGWEYTLEVQL